jgi:hypothetical protein
VYDSHPVALPEAGCGNGRIDPKTDEECDRTELGRATCGTFHFAAGSLRCSATCEIDTTDCDACVSGSGALACEIEAIDAHTASNLALATTDKEVAIAWASTDASQAGVHVARLGADLRLLEQSTLDVRPSTSVAIARSRSGYLAAFAASDGVHVQPLDADAHPRGRARLVEGAASPALTAATTGAAAPNVLLFTWVKNVRGTVERHAAVLDDNGMEMAPALGGFASHPGADTSAVATGHGFLVAGDEGPPEHRIVVTAIGHGGAIEGRHVVVAESRGGPLLMWTGSEARLVFHRAITGIDWMPLSLSGVPVGPAKNLLESDHRDGGDVTSHTDCASAVAAGHQTFVLLNFVIHDGHFGPVPRHPWDRTFSGLSVLRGVPAEPWRTPDPKNWIALTQEPIASYRMAAFGDGAVVAWQARRRPGSVVVARVTP